MGQTRSTYRGYQHIIRRLHQRSASNFDSKWPRPFAGAPAFFHCKASAKPAHFGNLTSGAVENSARTSKFAQDCAALRESAPCCHVAWLWCHARSGARALHLDAAQDFHQRAVSSTCTQVQSEPVEPSRSASLGLSQRPGRLTDLGAYQHVCPCQARLIWQHLEAFTTQC